MQTYVHYNAISLNVRKIKIFQTRFVQKIKTHTLCAHIRATDDNTIRRMRFACYRTNVTDTHLEYVTTIAFPRQQWFCERATMLRYTYIACLVIYADWKQFAIHHK